MISLMENELNVAHLFCKRSMRLDYLIGPFYKCVLFFFFNLNTFPLALL